jgi:hypothetical protein
MQEEGVPKAIVYHACRPIFVLCPAEFNHTFCRSASDIDLAKIRISVICEARSRCRKVVCCNCR